MYSSAPGIHTVDNIRPCHAGVGSRGERSTYIDVGHDLAVNDGHCRHNNHTGSCPSADADHNTKDEITAVRAAALTEKHGKQPHHAYMQ